MKRAKILCIFIFVLCCNLTAVFTVQAESAFSGGTGASNNPYLISNVEDLAQLSINVNLGNTYVNTYFKLTSDLNLADFNTIEGSSGFSDGKGWFPIGVNSYSAFYPFLGIFDGNNHIIKNLNINRVDLYDGDIGLFKFIGEGGEVKNLALVDCDINGWGTVGAISGVNRGKITGCISSGKIKALNLDVGGIVGSNSGTVENCYNEATVRGYSSVGGIAGSATQSSLINCYNTGTIAGSNRISGVLGSAIHQVTIENCYNIGSINNGYGSGVVVSNGFDRIQNCYYNKEIHIDVYNIEGYNIDLNTVDMTRADALSTTMTMSGDAWQKRPNDSNYDYYPELKNFANSTNVIIQEMSKNSVKVEKNAISSITSLSGSIDVFIYSLPLSGIVFVATYDDSGTLIELLSSQNLVGSSKKYIFNNTVEFATAKAFVWGDMEKINPLVSNKQLN